MVLNRKIWSKTLGPGWDGDGCKIKVGQAPKLQILGMDRNIICLAHVHRNIIENVRQSSLHELLPVEKCRNQGPTRVLTEPRLTNNLSETI